MDAGQPEPVVMPPAGGSPLEPAPDKPAWKPRLVRWAKWLGIGVLVSSVLAVLGVLGAVRYYEQGLPSVEQLKRGYEPPQVTRILARDGSLLANLFTERRTVIPLAEAPDHAKLAFLAAEDASFYEHEGLDYFGMLRAMIANVRAGRTVQGGSTITQQIVKNLLLDSERTYRRKIRETILARRLEQHLTKDEIFSLYLNHIYLGHGRYGVEEAARYYFGKKARELTLPEASLLAGVVASPERFSPRNDPDRALERRRYVLGQMLAKAFVTAELHAEASSAPLRLAPAADKESELAPEVVEQVKKVLEKTVGERARRGGFEVTTTIDPAVQAAARQALRDNLDQYAKRQKLEAPFTATKRRLWGAAFEGSPKPHKNYVGQVVRTDDTLGTIDVRVGDLIGSVVLKHEERYNPKRLPASEFAKPGALLRVSLLAKPNGHGVPQLSLQLGPESALVAIDVRSREVRALVGSYTALAGGLDRATRAHRQPGSAFKPFLYSYALHSRRFTPASLLELPGSKDGKLPARTLSVREALAKSDNAGAELLFRESGPPNVVQWTRSIGIESRLEPTPSAALGAYEVTPLEITNAYATFASGGSFAAPVLIQKIVAPDKSEVPLPPQPPARRVMPEDEAYLVTSLMRSVITSGTGKRAAVIGRPLAGKTGTTNDAKDAWFVGYSTEIAAGVWVGYDEPAPLGWGESGGNTALPAWIELMKKVHAKRPATEFPRPASIVVARIDPATGLLAYQGQEDAVDEEFLEGTAPAEISSPDAGAEVAEPDAGAFSGLDPELLQAHLPAAEADAGPIAHFGPDGGLIEEPPPF
jgi:penicillin-binding protein 1A